VGELRQVFGPSDDALKALTQLIHIQGVVMAFADLFVLLAVLFVALAGSRHRGEKARRLGRPGPTDGRPVTHC